MSVPAARICCAGCDFETREAYQPIMVVYRLDNGKEVKTSRSQGWCFDCAAYSHIENMDTEPLRWNLVRKERSRRERRYRAGELSKGFLAALRDRLERKRLRNSIARLDQELQELRDLIDIASQRKTPPRCLNCWSSNTASLTFDADDKLTNNFRHDCGGQLKIIDDPGGPRFNFAVTTCLLSQEGELLGEPLSSPDDVLQAVSYLPGRGLRKATDYRSAVH